MIAGFIDAYGMITYGVFVSFMSGNTTQTGYQTAEGAFGLASLSALAILFFVIGAFAGTLLVQAAGRLARRAVFGVVAAALAEVVGLTHFGFLSVGFGIAIVSVAMGVMNSAFSRVGAQSVSLTFVTGTLSRVGSHLALAARRAPLADAQGPWDTHLRRALMLSRVWAGFFAGAALSGAATPRYGAWVLLPPALILAVLWRRSTVRSAAARLNAPQAIAFRLRVEGLTLAPLFKSRSTRPAWPLPAVRSPPGRRPRPDGSCGRECRCCAGGLAGSRPRSAIRRAGRRLWERVGRGT